MRHVIIEGPDGAGKTVLAEQLCRRYGYRYHHEGPPPPGVRPLFHYAGLLAQAEHPTVFDRFHLGEMVYPGLLRGQPGLSPAELTLIDRLLNGLGVTMIGVLPKWETCLANTRSKKELINDETVMRAAYDGWRVLLNGTGSGVRVTDNCLIHRWTYESGVDFRLPKPRPACPYGVIGSPYASTLFVGEQINVKRGDGHLDLPFFHTDRSSGFLNLSLKQAMLGEGCLAFTNAFDIDGGPRDLPFIFSEMPNLERVIALGEIAEKQCRGSSSKVVPLHRLPHPAYWKRFKRGDVDSYAALLRRAYVS